MIVESPQKKPRRYGVTAFSSQAKNGMEADEMYRRRGGGVGKNKRWLDECLWYVQQRADKRDTEILQSQKSMTRAALKSISQDMISTFPQV